MQLFDNLPDCTLGPLKKKSLLLTIATAKLSLSRQMVSKLAVKVIQVLCLQHLFSISTSILLHLRQMHQGRSLAGTGTFGGLFSICKITFAISIPPLWLYASTKINLWHCSILNEVRNSCKIYAHVSKIETVLIYLYVMPSKFCCCD